MRTNDCFASRTKKKFVRPVIKFQTIEKSVNYTKTWELSFLFFLSNRKSSENNSDIRIAKSNFDGPILAGSIMAHAPMGTTNVYQKHSPITSFPNLLSNHMGHSQN